MWPFNRIKNLFDSRYFKKIQERHEESLRAIFRRFDELLKKRLKMSAPVGIESRYSLGFSIGRNWGRRTPYDSIWWETRLGFVLMATTDTGVEEPIACIGFEITEKTSPIQSLVIVQIQGVRGKKDMLKHLHWERLLFEVVMAHAKLLGMKELQSLPASRSACNPITNPKFAELAKLSAEESIALADRMHIIYDKTALRSGLVWSESHRAYHKAL